MRTTLFLPVRDEIDGVKAIMPRIAPDWVDEISALVAETRPQAEVELVQLLGPSVGTHAGPGAVGFFWFSDPETA